jgi:hypothetical protein
MQGGDAARRLPLQPVECLHRLGGVGEVKRDASAFERGSGAAQRGSLKVAFPASSPATAASPATTRAMRA